jgi:hypothetical protein
MGKGNVMKVSIAGSCGPGFARIRRVVGDAVVDVRVATRDGELRYSTSIGPCGECLPVYDAAVRLATHKPTVTPLQQLDTLAQRLLDRAIARRDRNAHGLGG